jgi:4-hydroxy-4-methyl-2-oxoglutarate aldolase
MTIERYKAEFRRMTDGELAEWRKIPTAMVGDALNRAQCMAGAIKPLRPNMRLVGQARTAQVPAADNAAIHAVLALARPGEVLVIDGQGHPDTGVWGGILTHAALRAQVSGVVLDGATRDSLEIAERGFPVFCRAVVPRGGQKGSYGMVDGPVSVGGVPVRSGDLVIGDGDGVAIVPLQRVEQTLADVRKIEAREVEILAKIDAGQTTAELLGITVPDVNQ